MQGWLMLNKPEGISSSAALNKIKKFVKPGKIGHSGTLDPFASGLLMVAVGSTTRLIEYSMAQEKAYTFSIKWGTSTDSIDSDGRIIAISGIRPSASQILEFIDNNKGTILQEPPIYSAINVNGRRAYDLARSGVDFSIKIRPVELKKLELLNHSEEESDFFLRCGKGFYVRSLVRDIANYCGVYGYTSKLRRISIGNFFVEQAFSLDYMLKNVTNRDDFANLLKEPSVVLTNLKFYRAREDEVISLRQGKKIIVEANIICELSQVMPENQKNSAEIAVFNKECGKLIGICSLIRAYLHPKKILL